MSARRFLFLQGPAGPFFRRLGARLQAAGHRVTRLNLNAGDRHDWPQGRDVRTKPADWPADIARIMAEERITDLILYGDCRPDHRAAIAAAKARGAAVHVFEEAYFRPGYMTLERGGANGHSPLPRNPAAIRARAARLPALPPPPALPDAGRERGRAAFGYYARTHIGVAFRRFPHRGWHRDVAPLTEGLGYLRRRLRAGADRRLTAQAMAAVAGRRYFVLPLQMDADFQLRSHSPYGSMRAALDAILADFTAHAPRHTRLLIKVHPHDNGRIDWAQRITGERIRLSPYGDLADMIAGAAGLVTVNSTAALQALAAGVPVKALGNAIYDVEGLTHRRPLASFWRAPQPPGAALFADFRKIVVHDAQIGGDHGSEVGLALLVENAAARLMRPALTLVTDDRLRA